MRINESQRETARFVANLQRVASLSFSIDHLHNLLIQPLTRSIPIRPVVSSTTAIFRHENVLRVVQTCPRRAEDVVDDLDDAATQLGLHQPCNNHNEHAREARGRRGLPVECNARHQLGRRIRLCGPRLR